MNIFDFSAQSPLTKAILAILLVLAVTLILLLITTISRNKEEGEVWNLTRTVEATEKREAEDALSTIIALASQTPTSTYTPSPTITPTPSHTPMPTNTPTLTPMPSPTPIPITVCEELIETRLTVNPSCSINLVSLGIPLAQSVKSNQPMLQVWEISNPDNCTISPPLTSVELKPQYATLYDFYPIFDVQTSPKDPFITLSFPDGVDNDQGGKYYGCWAIQDASGATLGVVPMIINVTP